MVAPFFPHASEGCPNFAAAGHRGDEKIIVLITLAGAQIR
jgi:hypothetical protein